MTVRHTQWRRAPTINPGLRKCNWLQPTYQFVNCQSPNARQKSSTISTFPFPSRASKTICSAEYEWSGHQVVFFSYVHKPLAPPKSTTKSARELPSISPAATSTGLSEENGTHVVLFI